MHRRIRRSVLAVAGAVSTLIALGIGGAATASAATAAGPQVITTSFNTRFAGYLTSGSWRFRFVQASVPMAKCQRTAANNAVAHIALRSNITDEVAHIDLLCGGGPGSVRFGTVTHAEGDFRLVPSVGDVMKISVYRNVAACQDEFVATNTVTRNTQKVTVSTPCAVVYRHAELGATLTNPADVVPPSANVRLWVFRNTAITSYSGIHGTLCGPWPTVKFIATTTGTVGGTVLLFPTSPSNDCHNFGVWLKGTG